MRRLAAGVAVLGGVLLASALGGVARADRLADRRAEADHVQAQLATLDGQLERSIERYNAARQRLAATEAAIRENTLRIRVAKQNLDRSESELARELVTQFRNGNPDAIQVLLGAGSIGDVLDRIDVLRRVSSQTVRLVTRVRFYRDEARRRQAMLAKQKDAREKAVAERASRRTEIQARLGERTAKLASISADIRRILAERAAAAAAAARRARQLAAAPKAPPSVSDPGIGGSGGDTGSGGSDGSDGGSGSDGGGSIPPPPPSHTGSAAADAAMSQLGVAYHWGGASPSEGFDCSGLVVWAYAQVGVSLPHSSYALKGSGTPVARDQLEPGDLVFFSGDDHMGIYIGGGQFVHAPHTGDVVKVSSLDGYSGYNGAVRI